jgi:hypothetical protein
MGIAVRVGGGERGMKHSKLESIIDLSVLDQTANLQSSSERAIPEN